MISTAVQLALVDLADYLEIHAIAVVGHSSGEIAAAYCVGFLDHESAIKVSYSRGLLATNLSKDATSERHTMVSVGIPAKDAPNELAKLEAMKPGRFEAARLTVSCINNPSNIIISGPEKYLDVAIEYFTGKNTFPRKLKVDVGYHSPQMQAVSEDYMASLSNLKARGTLNKIHMISSTIPGRVSQEVVKKIDQIHNLDVHVQG